MLRCYFLQPFSPSFTSTVSTSGQIIVPRVVVLSWRKPACCAHTWKAVFAVFANPFFIQLGTCAVSSLLLDYLGHQRLQSQTLSRELTYIHRFASVATCACEPLEVIYSQSTANEFGARCGWQCVACTERSSAAATKHQASGCAIAHTWLARLLTPPTISLKGISNPLHFPVRGTPCKNIQSWRLRPKLRKKKPTPRTVAGFCALSVKLHLFRLCLQHGIGLNAFALHRTQLKLHWKHRRWKLGKCKPKVHASCLQCFLNCLHSGAEPAQDKRRPVWTRSVPQVYPAEPWAPAALSHVSSIFCTWLQPAKGFTTLLKPVALNSRTALVTWTNSMQHQGVELCQGNQQSGCVALTGWTKFLAWPQHNFATENPTAPVFGASWQQKKPAQNPWQSVLVQAEAFFKNWNEMVVPGPGVS